MLLSCAPRVKSQAFRTSKLAVLHLHAVFSVIYIILFPLLICCSTAYMHHCCRQHIPTLYSLLHFQFTTQPIEKYFQQAVITAISLLELISMSQRRIIVYCEQWTRSAANCMSNNRSWWVPPQFRLFFCRKDQDFGVRWQKIHSHFASLSPKYSELDHIIIITSFWIRISVLKTTLPYLFQTDSLKQVHAFISR